MITTLEESTAFSPPAMTTASGSRAEIKAVRPKEAGRVLNSTNTWIAAGLTFAPIPVGLAGGIGGLVAAAYFYDKILVAAEQPRMARITRMVRRQSSDSTAEIAEKLGAAFGRNQI